MRTSAYNAKKRETMENIIYQNREITITSEIIDINEVKIKVNGKLLIWISNQEQYNFKKELTTLLDKYKI